MARGSAGRVVLNARSQKNRVPPGPGRERGAEGGLRGAGPSGAACGRKYCAVTGWRPRGCSRLPKLTILHFKLANVLARRLDSVTLRKTQAHSSRGSWSESEWERENTRATPGPVRRSQPGHSGGGRAARGRARGAEAPGSGPAREGRHAGPVLRRLRRVRCQPVPRSPRPSGFPCPPHPTCSARPTEVPTVCRVHQVPLRAWRLRESNTHPLRLRRVAAGTAPWHRTAASNGEPLTRAAASGAETAGECSPGECGAAPVSSGGRCRHRDQAGCG